MGHSCAISGSLGCFSNEDGISHKGVIGFLLYSGLVTSSLDGSMKHGLLVVDRVKVTSVHLVLCNLQGMTHGT